MNSTSSVDPLFFYGLVFLNGPLAVITTAGNVLILFAIYKDPNKDLRGPSMALITNLAFSNLLTGSVFGTFLAAQTYLLYKEVMYAFINAVVFPLGSLVLFVDNFTIAAMSFDRFLAVMCPLRYKSLVTSRSIRLAVFIIWLAAAVMCLLPLFGIPSIVFLLIWSHSHVSLPLVILTAMYVTIFKTLKKQRDRIRRTETVREGVDESGLEERRSIQRQRNERDRKLTKTLVLIVIMFWLAALPFFVSVNLYFVNMIFYKGALVSKRDGDYLWQFASRFVFINPALDPFLLAFRIPKIGRALVAALRCKQTQ